MGKIKEVVNDSSSADENDLKLQCIPLTTILLALGVKHVDYFSLDIEGRELDVLKTIDFETYDITVMIIINMQFLSRD